MAAPRSHSNSAAASNKAAFFEIFFGLLLKHAFVTTTEGIYFRTRSDDRLFNLARLRAKTKVRKDLIRDMLFADDAAVVATHTQEELQSLMDCFSQACKDVGLTISLKKTNVLGQDTEAPPVLRLTTTISMLSVSSHISAPLSLTIVGQIMGPIVQIVIQAPNLARMFFGDYWSNLPEGPLENPRWRPFFSRWPPF